MFLLWLRLPNVILGVLTVMFAYLSVRLITKDPWTPVVAASLVAFLPRFVFLSSFVTNDNLVDLLGAVLVFLSLRYAKAPSFWRMTWVGVGLRASHHHEALDSDPRPGHPGLGLLGSRMGEACPVRCDRTGLCLGGEQLVPRPEHRPLRRPTGLIQPRLRYLTKMNGLGGGPSGPTLWETH